MKTPERKDAEKCLNYRRASKRGERLFPDDLKFCTEMFAKYPKWYELTEEEVFNSTVPYGSSAKFKEGK